MKPARFALKITVNILTIIGCLSGAIQLMRPFSFVEWIETAPSVDRSQQLSDTFETLSRNLGWQGSVKYIVNGSKKIDKIWSKYPDIFANDRPFQINSMSKQFTAAAILRLQEQGRLSIYDPRCNFFAKFCEGDKKIVTLHHLLTHTSGLAPTFTLDDFIWTISPKEIAEQTIKLTGTPGKTFEYSNFGYQLLSAVIAKITGLEFSQAMKILVFSPAGLSHTQVYTSGIDPADLALGLSTWILSPLGPTLHAPVPRFATNRANSYGAGAILSTPEDLLKWAKHISQQEFLTKESYAQYLQPALKDYALGWAILDDSGERLVWHNGGSTGLHSDFYIGENDTYLLVMSNTHAIGNDIAKAMNSIQNLMTGKPYLLPQERKWIPSFSLSFLNNN